MQAIDSELSMLLWSWMGSKPGEASCGEGDLDRERELQASTEGQLNEDGCRETELVPAVQGYSETSREVEWLGAP